MVKIIDATVNDIRNGIKVNGIYNTVTVNDREVVCLKDGIYEVPKENCITDFVITCNNGATVINPIQGQPLGYISPNKELRFSTTPIEDVFVQGKKLSIKTKDELYNFEIR